MGKTFTEAEVRQNVRVLVEKASTPEGRKQMRMPENRWKGPEQFERDLLAVHGLAPGSDAIMGKTFTEDEVRRAAKVLAKMIVGEGPDDTWTPRPPKVGNN